jgi:hypothetical protein
VSLYPAGSQQQNDNVFTDMTGLPFQWHIQGDQSSDGVLRRIRFSESNIADADDYKTLELSSIMSDRMAIEGTKCGVANVSAALLDRR